MAAILDQSCVSCNISYLGNNSSCAEIQCPRESTKHTKWHHQLFKRCNKKKQQNTYISLSEIDDSDYPFSISSHNSTLNSDMTGSDWSLSSINSNSSASTNDSDMSMDTKSTDKKTKLRRFQTKVSPQ